VTLPASILRKAAAFLRDVAVSPIPPLGEARLRAAVAASFAEKLAPRRSVKKVLPFKPRAEKKEEKRLGRKEARAAVRAACVARSDGRCEACPEAAIYGERLEMDHFYGRAFSESVETCWMLCSPCHRLKTENNPSREAWDRWFMEHCARHGFAFRKRFYREPLRRRSP
jgi:5-methylcytosine-specific restriction endonuclease McrA